MNAEQGITFLQAHQPMPADEEITEEEGRTFAALLNYFEASPDPRCIPLFVNAVSPRTRLGMYNHIGFVLLAHPREQVIPHLRAALVQGNTVVRFRCCEWACDCDAWELVDLVRPLLSDPDEDVRNAARIFMECRAEVAENVGSMMRLHRSRFL